MATNAPPAAGKRVKWLCPICGLSSVQDDAGSFRRHLESLHDQEIKAKLQVSTEAAERFRNEVMEAAFSLSIKPPSPSGTQSPGATALEMGRLNISSTPGPKPPETRDHPSGKPQIRSGRPHSVDDSRLGQTSSHKQVRPPTRPTSATNQPPPAPATANQDFFKHSSASRPVSREQLEQTDDDQRRRKAPAAVSQPSPTPRRQVVIDTPADPRYPGLIMQPDSRGISHEQLSKEVRAIYASLTMVEARAIGLDKAKMELAQQGPLPHKALYGLIGVHKALLNEHHDFFLASQHPSASSALHRLASKYLMPARMWKHGIHSFLELLRHQLPHSIEFMIQFIIHAYQMMSLLLETVPSFEDTWIECLGDLSRYRMAVEEDDMKDREIWAQVARYWYCKAADKMPNVGRLYHHLAILARGNKLQQLYLYSRSLTSAQPFLSTRESIQTLLRPAQHDERLYFPEIDICFVKIHAALFFRDFEAFPETLKKFHQLLGPQIDKLTAKWREYGVYTASSNIGAMFDFGNRNHLTQLFEAGNFFTQHTTSFGSDPELQSQLQKVFEPVEMDQQATTAFDLSLELFFSTLKKVLRRPYDKNCQPFLHITLSFLQTLLSFRRFAEHLPQGSSYVIKVFLDQTPWQLITNCCNTSIKMEEFGSRFETMDFLQPEKSGDSGCLPEDYLLWGLLWTQSYYPVNHFIHANTDEERSIELPSTMHVRAERNLHLAFKIARDNDDVLAYSSKLRRWKVEIPETEDTVMGNITDMPEHLSTETGSELEKNGPLLKTALIGNDIDKSSATLQMIVREQHYNSVVITEKTIIDYMHRSRISSPTEDSAVQILKIISNLTHEKKLKIIDEQWNDKSDVLNQEDIPSQKSSDFGDTLVNTVKNAPNASIENLPGGVSVVTDDANHQEKARKNGFSFVPFNSIRVDTASTSTTHVTSSTPMVTSA